MLLGKGARLGGALVSRIYRGATLLRQADATTSFPTPTPVTPPPAGPSVTSDTATHTTSGMTLTGVVADAHGPVTVRTSSSPLTGQTGFHLSTTPAADGTLSLAFTAFTTTSTRYWQLENGTATTTPGTTILASGQVSAAPAATTPPATTPAATTSTAASTGGSGGELTDVLQTFSGTEYSADYHLFAAGLDWSKPVGLLCYIDGSGEYGIENPTETYLLAGTHGMVEVAKRQNLLLLAPFSPNRVERSWHHDDPEGYTTYLEELIRWIYGRYDLDRTRFVGGGYSSGAQVMSRYLTPQVLTVTKPAIALDGLILMISFGGHPAMAMGTANPEPKANLHVHWDVGDQDGAAGYDGAYGALKGEDWYRTNGWKTSITVIPGGAHARSDFGLVTDKAISRYVSRVASVGACTATRTSTGMTWAGKVYGTSSITLRASASPLSGGQAGFYLTVPVDATTRNATATFSSFTAGTPCYWQVEVNNPTPTAQGGQVIASGSVPAS